MISKCNCCGQDVELPDPPEYKCSVCGVLEGESLYGSLVSVRVVIAEGQEGFADITQLVCDEDLVSMQEGLLFLGFKDHRHGSINYLEDEKCPGADFRSSCPTPSEYGAVLVQSDGPVALN